MIHYQDQLVTVHHGDCLDVLRTLPDASIDAVVTDPPYGLEFMGKDWDSFRGDVGRGVKVAEERAAEMTPAGEGHSTSGGPYLASRVDSIRSAGKPFQDWCELWARECLRVLKPGGHILAFGGSRTWHRLASAIEDAGFEIRDSIAWLYGSGFPKSLDVSKALDAREGIIRGARGEAKTTNGSMSGPNYERTPKGDPAAVTAWEGWGTALKPAFEPIVVGRKPLAGTVAVNVLAHGTGAINIGATRTATAEDLSGGAYTERSSVSGSLNPSGMNVVGAKAHGDFEQPSGRWPTNVVLDESQAAALDEQTGISQSRVGNPRGAAAGEGWGMTRTGAEYDDAGGASRFFPTFRYEAKAPTFERPKDGEVQHPTVKPLDLMRWLVRLVTPPNGVVLEPFAGSGTTVEAALIEGFRCIAIEREADYLPLIEKRITKPLQQSLFGDDWDEAAS